MGVESLVQYQLGEIPTTPCREYQGPKTQGYGTFRINGEKRMIHAWVVEQLEGRPLLQGEVVMHHCDNPPCFLYEHLRRATYAENSEDARLKGRLGYGGRPGVSHWNHKLNENDVREIRSLAATVPQVKLAERFGVTQAAISLIVRRHNWRHI